MPEDSRSKPLAVLLASLLVTGLCGCGSDPLSHSADIPLDAVPDFSAFGPDFMWGAGSSSHQVEGNDVHSDWWTWATTGHSKTGEGSGLATDNWHLYVGDLDKLSALGLDTYRFSLSWARLFPQPGMTEPDPEAVAHYDALFAAMEQRHIRPMVTLHHFAMPQWVTDGDRWATGEALDDFDQLTRLAAHRWGRYVDWWVTINEPEIFVFHGWLRGIFPPGRIDPLLSAHVLANVMRAHARAYRILHEEDTTDADGDGIAARVGIAKLIIPVETYSSWNPIEQFGASIFGEFANDFWFDANQTGTLDLKVPFTLGYQEVIPDFVGTLDFVGVNYYSRQVFRLDPLIGLTTLPPPGTPVSALNVEIYPQGLYDALAYLAPIGVPIVVTENGIDDPTDTLREGFIASHLAAISRFKQDHPDVPVLGYIYWALTDNFEWENGFKPRFGLYEVDYATQKRTMRPSAMGYARMVEAARTAGTAVKRPRRLP